jgi:predicted protein tyrosine phosphatase
MHEIIPRLYLGSLRSASDRGELAERGITHVLSVCLADREVGHRQRIHLPPSEEDPCTRLVIAVEDTASARLDRHFDACSAFISEGLAKGAVLVHCKAGQSRSPTVVIAHLMREERWTAAAALRFVQQRRATVQPNIGFIDQLRALEARLGLNEVLADARSTPVIVDQVEAVADDDDASEAEKPNATTEELENVVSAVDVQVEVGDLTQVDVGDLFGASETRLRCERMRFRCQRLRTAAGVLGVAAPLRKRRYK